MTDGQVSAVLQALIIAQLSA